MTAKNADFIKDLAPLKYPLAKDPNGAFALQILSHGHVISEKEMEF